METNLVYKANEIIRSAKYDLTTQQQKFILYVISLIKPDDFEDRVFTVSVSEMCSLFGIENVGANYKRLKDSIDAVARARIWLHDEEKNVYKRLQWIERVSILAYRNTVTFQIDPRMRPYLFHLKKNFTAYELQEILTLDSKYSIRLFELLKSYESLHLIRFTLDELKEKFGIGPEMRSDNFRLRVVDVAVREINEKTQMIVESIPYREGKTIAGFDFIVTNDQIYYERNLSKGENPWLHAQ